MRGEGESTQDCVLCVPRLVSVTYVGATTSGTVPEATVACGSRLLSAKANSLCQIISIPRNGRPLYFVRCSNTIEQPAMDGEKIDSSSSQPLPGATIPLDSNGAHSGDSEVKKRARSNSPNNEGVEGSAKRQKGVAPIKAESVALLEACECAC